ncbi:hypothetical protein [Lactobacillus sp. Sy-1]|uniref:hypothetical protein n=1 Tax=Lactobacillus sp. Sy-1 TaxID=2109645 RepID=UPI001C561F57|nr:hypothetical protein [Lactobacillus sp. Sy-1]MBW1605762.1 hypothetical protein [Lactobacillus sp. Sy-1]
MRPASMTLIAMVCLLLLTTILHFQTTSIASEIRTNNSIARDYRERGSDDLALRK